MKKIALLGVCNSRNVLESAIKDTEYELCPYIFQPCFLDITSKDGLNIPYKVFYEAPFIKGKEETAPFTKKTMQFDLNKTALTTIESLNPDYLVIDLSSLEMRTYKISYNGKTVFSCNAYSPLCYENLKNVIDISIERTYISDDDRQTAVDKLSKYLIDNWDLNKVIIFNYNAPKIYKSIDDRYYEYDDSYWGIKQAKIIRNDVSLLKDKLNNVKIFEDADAKIAEGSAGEKSRNEKIPSTFHVTKKTQELQGLLFKKHILNFDVSDNDIEALKQQIFKEMKNE